ncbi:hypothetical protein CXF72_00340 [Psychromonas sp. MB-3u-54]|uniref:hypothetical protein n=1 Tax=Psychromonas sp. MB-3u-54 TaxID=2058319 RepID=UPI000C32DF67|nr:hypothetical protein [Psychromonas sp. MB-3u-54]PKH04542.1 hypothetical protein CXF72_00340 [Psychromonas sp. MB-3u-54]
MLEAFAGIGFLVCAHFVYLEWSKSREIKLEYKRIQKIVEEAVNVGVSSQHAKVINLASNSTQAALAFQEIVAAMGIKANLVSVFTTLGHPNKEILDKIPGSDRDIGITKALKEAVNELTQSN